MGEETRAPTTSQWKLRRLAKRSIAVFNRHAGVSGAIAAYQGSLIPRAEAYIQAYDAAALYEPRWRKEIAEGRRDLLRRTWSRTESGWPTGSR